MAMEWTREERLWFTLVYLLEDDEELDDPARTANRLLTSGWTDMDYVEHIFFDEVLPGTWGLTLDYDFYIAREDIAKARYQYKKHILLRFFSKIIASFVPTDKYEKFFVKVREEMQAQLSGKPYVPQP